MRAFRIRSPIRASTCRRSAAFARSVSRSARARASTDASAAACSRAAASQRREPREVVARPPDQVALRAREVAFVHEPASDRVRIVAREQRPRKAPLALGVARVEHLAERRLAPIEVGAEPRGIGGDPRGFAAHALPLERELREPPVGLRDRGLGLAQLVGRLGARAFGRRKLLLQAIDAGAQLAQLVLARRLRGDAAGDGERGQENDAKGAGWEGKGPTPSLAPFANPRSQCKTSPGRGFAERPESEARSRNLQVAAFPCAATAFTFAAIAAWSPR